MTRNISVLFASELDFGCYNCLTSLVVFRGILLLSLGMLKKCSPKQGPNNSKQIRLSMTGITIGIESSYSQLDSKVMRSKVMM